MRKFLTWTATATTVVLLLAAANASAGHFGKRGKLFAVLDGYQEVPAVSTSATGSLVVKVDRKNGKIAWTLHTSALEGEIWQAHLHMGRSRTNGGIVAFLCGTVALPAPIPPGTPECPPTSGGTVSGVIEADDVGNLGTAGQGIEPGEIDEIIDALKAKAIYVNIHSSKFPGGEIRGQIR